ncbi:MAG: tetratricopeptide repeat protein, partial [Pseudomonadota bacterium]
LRDTAALQEKAGLAHSAEKGAKFGVGLCHRGLAAVAEARGRLQEAAELRESSLALISESTEATHPEMRAAVDLLAGTYMAQGRFDLAQHLYQQIALELQGSRVEERAAAAQVMARRAEEVRRLQEQVQAQEEDAAARRRRELEENPALAADLALGRTREHLEALLREQAPYA